LRSGKVFGEFGAPQTIGDMPNTEDSLDCHGWVPSRPSISGRGFMAQTTQKYTNTQPRSQRDWAGYCAGVPGRNENTVGRAFAIAGIRLFPLYCTMSLQGVDFIEREIERVTGG
jgi:hypothetical protein